ncbi:MAG: DUF3300 domain-containing protein [Steroidobacteraceae bacterium]
MLGLVPILSTGQQSDSAQSSSAPSPAGAILSNAQLEQLVAPIALYPDSLLGPVLMASTYPLEIVQAQRWLQDPANAALKGDALTAALQQQRWDISVKSLVAFPGSLHTTPQQVVTTEDQEISIAPASAEVVYVPYYDPLLVYGAWPWIDYPPFFFTAYGPGPWPEYPDFVGGLVIGFGIGFPDFGPWWGWNYWDWHHHHIYLRGGHDGQRAGPWEHDPGHRHGVPYRNAAVATHFEDRSEAARREARGYEIPRDTGHADRTGTAPRGGLPASNAPPRAFESFGSGPQVRQESTRGASSRSESSGRAAPGLSGGGSRRH